MGRGRFQPLSECTGLHSKASSENHSNMPGEVHRFGQGGRGGEYHPPEGPARRLAAIIAADIAGYSRLMGLDEEGTHARVMRHRRELIDPTIAEYHGRV